MATIYSPQTHINKPPTRTSPISSATSTKGSMMSTQGSMTSTQGWMTRKQSSPHKWSNSCILLTTSRANVTAQGRARQDFLHAPTLWMTMRVPNNLVLNLTSMVLMVHIATMANNNAIMNNHNMMLHVG
jgi:hypothetical protein